MTPLQANQTELEFIKCNLCGSEDTRPVKEIDGWHIVSCGRCGFCFLNPRPIQVEQVYEKVDESRWHRRESQDSRPRELFFAGQLKAIEKALGPVNGGRCILDFGCGTGQFLDVALARGWETHGLEPDPLTETIEARGHKTYIGQLQEVEIEEAYFDAVFCSAVFEHLHNPATQLQSLFEIIKPGGVLLITSVPNFGSATIRMNIANFYANSPPGDVNFFTPKSMAKMVEANGFQVLRATSYGFDYNSFIKRRHPGPVPEDIARSGERAPAVPVVEPEEEGRTGRGMSASVPTAALRLGVGLYQHIGFFGLGSKIFLMAGRPS